MSCKWTSACVLFLAAGCTAYPTLKAVGPNCAAEAPYDLLTFETFELGAPADIFWSAGDTVDAGPGISLTSVTLEPITDWPCVTIVGDAGVPNTRAGVLHSSANNDWGSLFGHIRLGATRNAADFEGLAFWAKAPGATTKAYTVLLGDSNTDCIAGTDAGVCAAPPTNCIPYATDGGAMPVSDGTGMVIPGTGGTPPAPDACGNAYQVVDVANLDWSFHTIPFNEFQQAANPNRVPNAKLTETGPLPDTALLTNELLTLIFRMPKEAIMELWLDNLSFYRRRGAPGVGGDGGVDAPQM